MEEFAGARGAGMLKRMPVSVATPIIKKGFADPFGAHADLENAGLKMASGAQKGMKGLDEILNAMSSTVGKGDVATAAVPGAPADGAPLADHAKYCGAVFKVAKKQRDEGLGAIAKEGKENFGFIWPEVLIREYGPQAQLTEQSKNYLTNDRAYIAYATMFSDWKKLMGTASAMSQLLRPEYLASLKESLEQAGPISEAVEGVTGSILFAMETPDGLIIFGGSGDNTYNIKSKAVALIVDLGGNDKYTGLVASSFSEKQPNAMVIDFAGDDSYQGDKFGLATGRTGAGILADLDGKDTYTIDEGSGGAGFMGVGILIDAAGDDTYNGGKWSIGVAFGGMGLLYDLKGNDTYKSRYMSIGFAGPGAVGAVVDAAGDDQYTCGFAVRSGYEEPPGQFDAFGMAMGMGRRILAQRKDGGLALVGEFSLAGGNGIIIDVAGDDKYNSSNFSQACGYFFGSGLKLDLAGNDIHSGARYSFASIPHEALGLFIDYTGSDKYTSTGPTWTCGCGWDFSIALCIDADGDDEYDLAKADGPAISYPTSWGVFADLNGNDKYNLRSIGLAGQDKSPAIAVAYDGGGKDEYEVARPVGSGKYEDGATIPDGRGGVFSDR